MHRISRSSPAAVCRRSARIRRKVNPLLVMTRMVTDLEADGQKIAGFSIGASIEDTMLHSRSDSVAGYNRTPRSRSALPITETELNDIASAATIGLSNNPNDGYSTPAAIGIPIAL